jgi:hypothetical protein
VHGKRPRPSQAALDRMGATEVAMACGTTETRSADEFDDLPTPGVPAPASAPARAAPPPS